MRYGFLKIILGHSVQLCISFTGSYTQVVNYVSRHDSGKHLNKISFLQTSQYHLHTVLVLCISLASFETEMNNFYYSYIFVAGKMVMSWENGQKWCTGMYILIAYKWQLYVMVLTDMLVNSQNTSFNPNVLQWFTDLSPLPLLKYVLP